MEQILLKLYKGGLLALLFYGKDVSALLEMSQHLLLQGLYGRLLVCSGASADLLGIIQDRQKELRVLHPYLALLLLRLTALYQLLKLNAAGLLPMLDQQGIDAHGKEIGEKQKLLLLFQAHDVHRDLLLHPVPCLLLGILPVEEQDDLVIKGLRIANHIGALRAKGKEGEDLL